MTNARSLRLFRLFGIEVRLHWAWVVVAAIEVWLRRGRYDSFAWNIAEYLSLFLLVLMHEFGHALACRSVGGTAERILLWPLGGVAYVKPPFRPGALLWSLAAGPLVNAALAPLTIAAAVLGSHLLPDTDFANYLLILALLNAVLLVFNCLPIYPLDGGQVTRALLWYLVGPHRSLLIAASVGLVASVGVVVAAVLRMDAWLGVLAVFGGITSWRSVRLAWMQVKLAARPRAPELACAACGQHPPTGVLWRCATCWEPVELAVAVGRCPHCGTVRDSLQCVFCGHQGPPVVFPGAKSPEVDPAQDLGESPIAAQATPEGQV